MQLISGCGMFSLHEGFSPRELQRCSKGTLSCGGKLEGAAHIACNMKLKIRPKMDPIKIFFHSSKTYDTHLIFQNLGSFGKKISGIATNVHNL